MHGPDPSEKHPMEGFPQVVFIKNYVTTPNIVIGDYTYCDAPDGPQEFFDNILYHFPFIGDRLVIGRYCAIARKVTFIMNGGSHAINGFSTYPFHIFGHGWEQAAPAGEDEPHKGDTVIGHDVWLGYGATILPGVQVGHGSIVAAKTVCSKDVPPYSVVAGNPAMVVRRRFAQDVVDALLDIAWWDWPAQKVTRNIAAITGGDIQALRQAL